LAAGAGANRSGNAPQARAVQRPGARGGYTNSKGEISALWWLNMGI